MATHQNHNFKKGDVVCCVNSLHWENVLTLGKTYEVLGVADHTVSLVADSGSIHTFYASRFTMGVKPSVGKEMLLPTDPTERKGIPITTGVLDYFPLAIAEVAKCSKACNDQHNPGQPLHWAKGKSTDHADCIPRHLIDRGAFDTDGVRHSAKLAWRALALLQIELEEAAKAAKG